MTRAFQKLQDLKSAATLANTILTETKMTNAMETFFLKISIKIIAKIAEMGSEIFCTCLD
jgi:hypothetical protein